MATTTAAADRVASTTDGPKRHKFLVYAPDMTDPEGFSRRLQVRSEHLAGAKANSEKGVLSEYIE
jgi:uncharacterized protein